MTLNYERKKLRICVCVREDQDDFFFRFLLWANLSATESLVKRRTGVAKNKPQKDSDILRLIFHRS